MTPIFEMLADTTRAPDNRLPDTGVSIEQDGLLSAACIDRPTTVPEFPTLVQVHATQDRLLEERLIK